MSCSSALTSSNLVTLSHGRRETPKPTPKSKIPKRKTEQKEPEQEDLTVGIGDTIGTTASGGSIAVPSYLGELSAKKKQKV